MPGLVGDQYRALAFLTGRPDGRTEWTMLVHGFSVAWLTDLIRAGLVIAKNRAKGMQDVRHDGDAEDHRERAIRSFWSLRKTQMRDPLA
jgi:hypothetical protein